MPNTIVINTSPIIALVSALGDLKILSYLYKQVLVPYEVCQEILAGGKIGFAISAFNSDTYLQKQSSPLQISPFLLNSLDLGEASVIQLALDKKITTVCIDEAIGRRIARLNGLSLTGCLGILLKAKQKGYNISIRNCIDNMKKSHIYLSQNLIDCAIEQAGE